MSPPRLKPLSVKSFPRFLNFKKAALIPVHNARLRFLHVMRPIAPCFGDKRRNMSNYDLQSISLPVLNGLPLKLFAAAFGNPLFRPILKKALLRNGGLLKLRELAFNDPPTFYPLIRSGKPATARPFAARCCGSSMRPRAAA